MAACTASSWKVPHVRHSSAGNTGTRRGGAYPAVLLIEQGLSYPAAARYLGESARTLARWVRRYRDHGLAGLREHEIGRPRRLTREQLAEVRGVIDAPEEPWTAASLAAWIEERFGVRLSDRHCRRLLGDAVRRG